MAIQFDNTNTGTLTMKPASSGNYSIVWPATAGTTNYFLQTDGSGITLTAGSDANVSARIYYYWAVN